MGRIDIREQPAPGEAPGGTPSRAPNCLRCRHFRVTWEPAFPRSCLLFGVKCRSLPSQEVFLSSGRHCFSFALKPGLKEDAPAP